MRPATAAAPRRVPHCSHWGAYTLLVQGGRIVGVEPFAGDPAPSPIIHSVPLWADPARRIAQPMVREGWLRRRGPGERRADERFVPVAWDQALALAAAEVERVRAEHGNDSIFAGSYGWASSGRLHHPQTLLRRMLALAGGYTGHVDTYSIGAGRVILRHVLGGSGACEGDASSLDDVAEHADTLLVLGALTPRTAQNEAGGIAVHRLGERLQRIAERRARVVLVSPLRDDLPAAVGAQWWPIRPNTDTALLLGLAGEIVAAGRHDRHFLAACCSGADAWLAHLEGRDDGCPKNAAWAAAITGLDAAAIAALALQLVDTRSMITVSWSLQRAHHGEQPYWAALGLAALIGQIGRPGCGVGFGYGSLGGVGEPVSLARPPALPAAAKPNAAFIPVARIADLLLQPGQPFTYDGRSHRYPDIRLVWWAGGNPFHHHQDLNRLRRAWARPETIIVQDPVWTATARRADIVLPATTSIERNDLAANRRSPVVVAMQQAIAPVGQARNDFDILSDVAARLGVEPAFTEGRDEMAWLRHLYDLTRDDAQQRLEVELPPFDDFWARGWVALPAREHHVLLDGFVRAPAAQPLATESGRIVLHSAALAGLALADCPPHPTWQPPAEWLGSATARRDGLLHLVSRQPDGRLHSQLDEGDASRAHKLDGRERVLLNPADARARGIADGDAVRLFNDRGQCLAGARLSADVAAGVAVLPTGAHYTPADEGDRPLELAGNPNVLTLDIGSSAFGQGCAAHTCLVQVERWGGAGRAG